MKNKGGLCKSQAAQGVEWVSVNQNQTTTEQRNNPIEIRQGVYKRGLVGYRAAQFEIIDAELSNARVQSYAELPPIHFSDRAGPLTMPSSKKVSNVQNG